MKIMTLIKHWKQLIREIRKENCDKEKILWDFQFLFDPEKIIMNLKNC